MFHALVVCRPYVLAEFDALKPSFSGKLPDWCFSV